jgi:DNA invertase Pin-like site-specific DNA recombinase
MARLGVEVYSARYLLGEQVMKAIGYVRRSTDKQDLSLEQQREKLQAFAASRGWDLVEVFEDDAISGSDMNRPGLRAMLERAKASREAGAVIAWDRNRLARPKDPMDGMMLERELRASGQRVYYAATGQEADRSFASGLMGYVEHFQNGDYLRKLSRDTAMGLVSRAKRGLWAGGPIPFGYDRMIVGQDGKPRRVVRDLPDRSQVVLHPESGDVLEHVPAGQRYAKQDHEFCSLVPSESARVKAVRKMFADYAGGKPIRRIRDEINRSGVRTSRGRPLTCSAIHPMLDNPAYLGQCVYNRRTESKWHRLTDGQSVERTDEGLEARPASDWIVVDDAWPALVDRETFEQVQTRRKASKEAYVKMTGRKVHSSYLLTGLLTCGVCGGPMFGQTTHNTKGRATRYYVCTVHHRGDHEKCPKRYTVPADFVEEHILGLIRRDLEKLHDDEKLHEYVRAEVERLTGGESEKRNLLQQHLVELDQRLARVRDHLRRLDPETAESLGLYDEARTLGEERKEVERNLAGVGADVPSLPSLAEIRERSTACLEHLEAVLAGATIEEKRELVGKYIRAVRAIPDTQRVEIRLYTALFNTLVAGACYLPLHIRAAFWQRFRPAA